MTIWIHTGKVSDSNLGHFIGYVSSEIFKRIEAHTRTGIKKKPFQISNLSSFMSIF